MVLHQGQLLPDELFNVPEIGLLVNVAEADGDAAAARPAGASNAVDVGLRHVGQLVVHHAGQLVYVNAPGGDVRGHQNPDGTRLEALQGRHPGVLALVPMDGHGGNSGLGEPLRHPVGPVLGVGEHQDALVVPLPQKVQEELPLVALVHPVHLLADGLHRGGLGGHLHPDGVAEDGFGQLRNLLGHGGGEEEGLPLLGKPGDDLPDVVNEAHVQHPVRLVQHEDLQAAQVNVALIAQVVQPPGGGNEHVHPPLQSLHLGALANAAENHRVPDVQIGSVLIKVFLDLQGQLPGGGQHQSPDGLVGLGDPGL